MFRAIIIFRVDIDVSVNNVVYQYHDSYNSNKIICSPPGGESGRFELVTAFAIQKIDLIRFEVYFKSLFSIIIVTDYVRLYV